MFVIVRIYRFLVMHRVNIGLNLSENKSNQYCIIPIVNVYDLGRSIMHGIGRPSKRLMQLTHEVGRTNMGKTSFECLIDCIVSWISVTGVFLV